MTQKHAKLLQEQLGRAYKAGQFNGSDVNQAIESLALELAHVAENEFLTQYALAMSRALRADCFIIGRMNPFSNIMRSVRLVADNQIVKNITYSLDGTPCARAIDSDTCVYADNVAAEFPRDAHLKNMNIKGYVGAPLRSSSGDVLGIVVAMTKEPIADAAFASALMEYFRARAACALETSEILDRYAWAIAEASDGIWDWDVVTGGTTISERIQRLLGYAEGEGPYDLMQIESAVHPEDRNTQVDALHNHLNHGAPYDVRIRLRDRNGVYRWFRSRGKAMRNENGKPIRMIGCFSDIHDLVIEAKRGQKQN